jgi:hypothetical protein
LTLLAEGRACFAPTLRNNRLYETVFSSILLFAGLLILAPLASAQLCGPTSASLHFDSIYSDGPDQCPAGLNTGDLVDLSGGNVGGGRADHDCYGAGSNPCFLNGGENESGDDSSIPLTSEKVRPPKPPDFNRSIFFRNKLEFSQDLGWLPINVPFPFDFMLSDQYQLYPLKYTLVPIIGSLRWQLDSIKGPPILRGNWDFEFSGAVVAIPRGPETRYFAYLMGMRRNFVPRNWRATSYFDWRIGLGDINAKGPLGVPYAQGQNFTFTLNMGSGVRYNFSPRYAITAGLNWMHISNANLSEHSYNPADKYPWGFINYGINVYGPMVGVDIQLRKHPHSEQ